MRNALSSSGEVRWFTWEDYAPQPLIDKFESDTGIKLKVTTFSSNEDCLNKLKAASGEGWDLVSPSIAWVEAHVEILKQGRRLGFAECRLKVGERLILRASATFAVVAPVVPEPSDG